MNQPSSCSRSKNQLFTALRGRAQAEAVVTGGESHPDLSGVVRFYRANGGVIVCAEISGLPQGDSPCQEKIFGFHIHEGTDCGGNLDNPFANTLSHYNPRGCEHPNHAGDLPPLFGNGGLALCAFFTTRFSISEVIGKTVVIHDHPDDFTTQPSGNSGTKIACGVIRRAAGLCP